MTPRTTRDEPNVSRETPADGVAAIWVVSVTPGDDVAGRLGDARELADRCASPVAVLRFDVAGEDDAVTAQGWIESGADRVHVLRPSSDSQSGWIDAALDVWRSQPPLLILTSADRIGRAWSARLAARSDWPLVSPALLVQARGERFVVTRLDRTGRRAQQIEISRGRPAIVALRPGVAQPAPRDESRRGAFSETSVRIESRGGVRSVQHVPPDPKHADIRHLSRLVAGGRGVGSREGFATLERIADKLGAGVAVSRMVVDLGWMPAERQVGQTGKTVQPELYLACGISGASHHLEGMSQSRHIAVINTDADAPLMQMAELALQADLQAVLSELDRLLERAT